MIYTLPESYLCSVGLETLFRVIPIILLIPKIVFLFIQEVCKKFDPLFLFLGVIYFGFGFGTNRFKR